MIISEIITGTRISFNGYKGTISDTSHNWYGDLLACDLKFDNPNLIPNPLTLKWQGEFEKLVKLDNLDQVSRKDAGNCTCGAKYTSFPDFHLRNVCNLYKDKTII